MNMLSIYQKGCMHKRVHAGNVTVLHRVFLKSCLFFIKRHG